jgi:hypothetical protein
VFGLSITAIGQRELSECLEIYEELKAPLSLEYLELAVGTRCDLRFIPKDIALVIHDRCLYEGAHKLPFSLAHPDTWQGYKERSRDRNILLLSMHPPKRNELSLDKLKSKRDSLEKFLNIPVCLEVMPNYNYWLSEQDCDRSFRDLPLLLDISHINLWSKGDSERVKGWVEQLLPQALAIHLSHNNGRSDSHDLIPKGIWFEDRAKMWKSRGLLVTYESLPEEFARYERMDKLYSRLALQRSENSYKDNIKTP